MDTLAPSFGIPAGTGRAIEPIIFTPDSENNPGEDMSRRRPPTGEHAAFDAESMQQSMQLFFQSQTAFMDAQTAHLRAQDARPQENGNGATSKRVTWLMAVFAMVTLLGTGGNFLTSSGIAIGNKAKELETIQKDFARLERENEKLTLRVREYEVWLQTTREKLSDKGWKLPPVPKGE